MSDQRLYDLAYLAGLWDGEGYIGLSVNTRRRTGTQYYPRITLTNTNPDMIAEVRRILDGECIAYHISEWHGVKRYKLRYTIEMTGFRRTLKWLFVVEPHIRSKQLQSRILMAWLWSRLRVGMAYRHTPYSIEEIACYHALKELNLKGNSPIPREHTPNVAEWAAMMCSELRSKGAEATEMIAHLSRGEGWEMSQK